jgi:hypothetical protein
MALPVSPETWIAILPEGSETPASFGQGSAFPLADGVWLVPQGSLTGLAGPFKVLGEGLKKVEVAGPWACAQLVAAAAQALADVEVPLLLVSGLQRVHFFVPEKKLGRALAALRQARLERFSPEA